MTSEDCWSTVNLWNEDRQNRVQNWLNNEAYMKIDLAGSMDEGNHYGIDDSAVLEPGCGQSQEHLNKQRTARIRKADAHA